MTAQEIFPLRRVLVGLILAFTSNIAQADLRVHTPQANLRGGPAVKYSVTGVARSGESLKVKAYEAGYVQVSLPSGKSGWIHAESQGWEKATILAALNGSASASEQSPSNLLQAVPLVTKSAAPGNFTLSLSDLGYQQGHYFEGAYGVHSQDYFFPLPQGAKLNQGMLRVYFSASPQLSAASNLRFDINGKPAQLVSLENRAQPTYVDIPVSQDALQNDALRLTVKAVLTQSENRCLDERRLVLDYVHILPQTSLTLGLDSVANLAAAWTSLPAHVHVGIPAAPDESSAAALLQVAVWLRGMGRQVSFVSGSQAADVLVDSDAELNRRYPNVLPQTTGQEGALALTRNAAGQPLILISDHVLARPLASQPLPWAVLLRGEQFRHAPVISPANNRQTVDLMAVGLGETQYVSRAIDWNVDLSAPLVPANKQLQRLTLNIVAAPQTDESQQLLQIFLNGKLQEIRPLERDGKPHTLHFDLERSLQRAGTNSLRIAVQRTDEQGDCRGDLTAFPVQLLPGSRVDLADVNIAPSNFNDLRAYFAKGVEIYLTPDSQKNLLRELQLSATIFSNLGLTVGENQVHFMKAGEPFEPKQPFVLIGRGITPEKAAVRFDRGQIRVSDSADQPLLALDQMPAIGLAQMVVQNGIQGLSVLAPQEGVLPAAARLHLDHDDVAFIGEQGIALTLDSREPSVSKVDYPNYGGWRDWFAQYRFWLIALGWMLIVAVLVSLYRKTRKHEKTA